MIVAKKDNGLIGIIRPDGKEIAGPRYESVQWLETTELYPKLAIFVWYCSYKYSVPANTILFVA